MYVGPPALRRSKTRACSCGGLIQAQGFPLAGSNPSAVAVSASRPADMTEGQERAYLDGLKFMTKILGGPNSATDEFETRGDFDLSSIVLDTKI